MSGDHLETCRVIALRSGIINQYDMGLEGTAMTGEQFREAVGKYTKVYDHETGDVFIEFENERLFKAIKKKVKIIARATYEDKLLLIRGIQ